MQSCLFATNSCAQLVSCLLLMYVITSAAATCKPTSSAPPSEHVSLLQVFCEDNNNILKYMANMLPSDRQPVFLDAGANIGGATMLYTIFAAYQAYVVAVEANPVTFERTKLNAAELGCASSPWHETVRLCELKR